MSGRWGVPIGFCLLILLIYLGSGVLYCLGGPLWFVIFLAGPFCLSAATFFLSYVRGAPVEIGMMWSGFRNYGTSLGAFWLTYLLTLLWTLLGALPGLLMTAVMALSAIRYGRLEDPPGWLLAIGITGYFLFLAGTVVMSNWASMRYSQTWFLLADHPSMGVLNAIRRSIEMMRGHKLRLFGMTFLLGLLFVAGTILTCGIGGILFLIFGYPFLGACLAVFHEDLAPPAQMASQGRTGWEPAPLPAKPGSPGPPQLPRC